MDQLLTEVHEEVIMTLIVMWSTTQDTHGHYQNRNKEIIWLSICLRQSASTYSSVFPNPLWLCWEYSLPRLELVGENQNTICSLVLLHAKETPQHLWLGDLKSTLRPTKALSLNGCLCILNSVNENMAVMWKEYFLMARNVQYIHEHYNKGYIHSRHVIVMAGIIVL